MPETAYNYNISTDFPDGKVNTTNLSHEINISAIVTALDRIDTEGGLASQGVITGGSISIVFKDTLSTGDKTLLDGDTTSPAGGLIAAHDNSPSVSADVLTPVLQAGTINESGFQGRPVVGGGRRSGYVLTSSTAAVPIRASSYFSQGFAVQRSIKSLSADDTAAGSGARKVKITYYDDDMLGPYSETITLNGTTAVATTATNIRFVEKLEVVEVGNGSTIPAGTIQLFDDDAGLGGLITSILAGDGRTYHAHHFVAADRTCFITEIQVAATAASGVLTVNAQDIVNANKPQVNLDISFLYDSVVRSVDFVSPIPVAGPAIIWLVTKPNSASSSTTHGVFGYFEYKN